MYTHRSHKVCTQSNNMLTATITWKIFRVNDDYYYGNNASTKIACGRGNNFIISDGLICMGTIIIILQLICIKYYSKL